MEISNDCSRSRKRRYFYDKRNANHGACHSASPQTARVVWQNELTQGKKQSFFSKALHIICEPMFLLLIVAATIYFIWGEPRDGIIENAPLARTILK